MRTRQWEMSFVRMIELPQRPIPSVVACLALLPHFSRMRIILAMACDAGLRRTLVKLVGVTALAFSHLVPAEQRKRRAIMVDDNLRPAFRIVAARAIGAEFSAMRVFARMTGYALHIKLFTMGIVLMTTLATQRTMASGQWESRELRMIETDLFP